MRIISFIPVGLACILGALTDIRHGRVRNIHLLATLMIWAGMIAYDSIASGHFVLTPAWGLNVLLAFTASLVFYLTDIWSPGDCKMYILIAMAYPMDAYVVREGNVFPALSFIIYSFGLGYLALIGGMVIKKKSGQNETYFQKPPVRFFRNRLLSIFSNAGLIMLISDLIQTVAGRFYQANQMLCTLSIVGIICLTQEIMTHLRHIMGGIGLLYCLIATALNHTWAATLYDFGLCAVIALLIERLNAASSVNAYRAIPGEAVRPGMILSLTSIVAMRACIDPNLPRMTTENRRSRLTESQAEAVKTWCRNAKSPVVIVETIPFAPFIALSVAVEILRYLIWTH